MVQEMELTVENLQRKIFLNSPQIRKIAKAILKEVRISKGNFSLVFVTHQRIRALNKKFLRRNHATDVLAFAKDLSSPHALSLPVRQTGLPVRQTGGGDIFISVDAARSNAAVFKTSLEYELVLYVTHGILHLLGFDDHAPADIKRMRRKEKELMEHLKNRIKNVVREK